MLKVELAQLDDFRSGIRTRFSLRTVKNQTSRLNDVPRLYGSTSKSDEIYRTHCDKIWDSVVGRGLFIIRLPTTSSWLHECEVSVILILWNEVPELLGPYRDIKTNIVLYRMTYTTVVGTFYWYDTWLTVAVKKQSLSVLPVTILLQGTMPSDRNWENINHKTCPLKLIADEALIGLLMTAT